MRVESRRKRRAPSGGAAQKRQARSEKASAKRRGEGGGTSAAQTDHTRSCSAAHPPRRARPRLRLDGADNTHTHRRRPARDCSAEQAAEREKHQTSHVLKQEERRHKKKTSMPTPSCTHSSDWWCQGKQNHKNTQRGTREPRRLCSTNQRNLTPPRGRRRERRQAERVESAGGGDGR